MSHNDVSQLFFSFVRDAITFGGQANVSGHPSIVLGNVEFWIDADQGLAYSTPTHQWDLAALQTQLAHAVALAPDYQRVAYAEGYDLVARGGGFSYRVYGTVNTAVYSAERLAWRAACIDNGLMPRTRDAYAASMTKAQASTNREDRLFKALAERRGFRLHVWNAVENGDPTDSWFWKLRGSRPQESESAATFATEADAWRDCCLINDLLNGFRALAQAHDFKVVCTEFRQWYWEDPKGTRADRGLPSEAEAWLNCCLHHNLTEQLVPAVLTTHEPSDVAPEPDRCVP